jgi:hypothetical protein
MPLCPQGEEFSSVSSCHQHQRGGIQIRTQPALSVGLCKTSRRFQVAPASNSSMRRRLLGFVRPSPISMLVRVILVPGRAHLGVRWTVLSDLSVRIAITPAPRHCRASQGTWTFALRRPIYWALRDSALKRTHYAIHGSSLLVFPAVRTGANIHRASRPYAELLCRECNAFASVLQCSGRGDWLDGLIPASARLHRALGYGPPSPVPLR